MLAAAVCGKIETGRAGAALNAVSHITWGKEALASDELSWKYTAIGIALNAAANTLWAALYEMFFGREAAKRDLTRALGGGAVVSAIAYFTDFHVVPARLTPGFEKRLSKRRVLAIYTVLALGLSFGSRWRSRVG
jgi:hypothetical protein